MVNDKVPPNGEKNQQFKDSAIWQAALALSQRFSIALLTNDKGFFGDRDPTKGLAANLVQNCVNEGTDVKGYYGIAPYLDSLRREEPEFDREKAKELIVVDAKPRLKLEAERWKIAPTEILDFHVSAFPTEDPDRLAIDYSLTFKLAPVSPEYRVDRDQLGVVHGSAYFLPKVDSLTDHYVQRIAVRSGGSLYARGFKDYDGSFAFPRPLPWD